MRFANPEWFSLMWMIPLLWIVSMVTARRARKRLEQGLGTRMTPLLSREVSLVRRRLKLIARSLAIAFAITALARPQAGKGLSEIKVRGVELMVVLDVSTSMLAEDIKPSRLAFAKAELSRLFDMLSGDKVGLVGFAGSALLLSPLTTDISSLKMFLDSLSPYSVQTQGTYFEHALREAADSFDRGGVEDSDRVKTTRVILVLSDGEDQEKGALDLAKKLGGEGIRIFTVAFGTERGGLIPIRDERGYLRSYKKDKAGKEVVSQVKGEFLKDLARVGQGTFHFASFGGSEARAVKADIDRLQKADFASSLATQYEERFQWFLFAALAFALFDLLIGERAGEDRVWRGRFESGLKLWWLAPMACALCAIAPEPARADEFGAVRRNNRAVDQFKAERYNDSLDGFTKALTDLPDSPEVHFNLGNAYAANKDEDKALSEYTTAFKMNPSPELAYNIAFNAGNVYASKKQTQEALDSYQTALKFKPDSIETKTNIELLFKGGDGEGEGEKSDKDGKDKKDQKDDPKAEPNPKDTPKPQTGPTPKPTPRPFKSEQLSQQDVGRILEEIKRQEDQVREKMQREGGKDAPRDKDW
jgi:Ca-activated chloride channel homolog